jgi:hypothetical protein
MFVAEYNGLTSMSLHLQLLYAGINKLLKILKSKERPFLPLSGG